MIERSMPCQPCCGLVLKGFFSMRVIATNHRMCMSSETTTKRSSGSVRRGYSETWFSRKQLNRIEQIIEDHQDELMRAWDEFFNE